MNEPSPELQARPDRPAPARGVERYWYIVAGIASLIYLLALAWSPILNIIDEPRFLRTYEPYVQYGFYAMIFIILGSKALIQTIRKPAWPEALMLAAAGVYIIGVVLEFSPFGRADLGTALDELGWILLAIAYYGWSVKSSPGEKITGVPLAFQILILALGFGMLYGLSQAMTRHLIFFSVDLNIIVDRFELAMVAVMVVAAIFRALRVGAWPDWLQFAGLGAYFVLSLTVEIIALQIGVTADYDADLRRLYIYLFVSIPGLLLFAIGFFAARSGRREKPG
jgi:hypothetical protein